MPTEYILIKTPKQKKEERQINFAKRLINYYLNIKLERIKQQQLTISKKFEELEKLKPFAPEKKVEIPKPKEIPKLPLFSKTYSLFEVKAKDFSGILVDAIVKRENGTALYQVNEPELDEEVYNKIKELISKKLKKTPELVTNHNFIMKVIKKSYKALKKEFTIKDLYDLKYYLIRDFVGFGKIQPLIADKNIESIFCKGLNQPIAITYKEPFIKGLDTNIRFKTKQEINSFLKYLAKKSKQEISEDRPLIQTILPNKLKLLANFGTGVIESKFTIYKSAF